MLQKIRKRRSATMSLTRVIKEKFGSEYEVQPFGSTRYGVSSSEADMDMVIIDPSRPHGISPDDKRKQPAIYDVRRVADTLRRAGFTQIKSIPRASVPIVQFRDPLTSLDCDININERLGIFNSDLINAYCSNMVTLRPLLFSIKTWAKSKGLNSSNPPSGELRSFSSYALTMMTIGFLQHRGYLPNLQAHLPPLEASGYNMNFWRTRPRPTCCDCRFYTKPPSWKQPPHLPNQQGLLRDWFQFWAHEFKYNTQMVSIREGGIVERRDTNDVSNLVLTTSIPLSGPPFLSIPIRVMDPFIVEKNVACSVSARAMERFARECGEWTRNGQ
ncbi:hypothetical protein DFP72DRAFT_1019684 [Ephemerocybe angulata]|uniref:polynucleotide adenylyltransferase n=1 Tax=Ephemerocybe angulata TaxID=980116 RepID=A0A8H6HBI0_9AGAR|nr:hypothetical protein DFP72DRAFT_1019684 [Tulosesus angulatus]